ncbi:MAG: CtsR family transcriptional regulator [Clostridia bacterium]|nr:CtsR family transcriptional regulator [Clostridia bacterium]
MRISDLITREILKMLDASDANVAEIQRNELAQGIGCVPSQINYVLSSRFTPEHGYIIESRRGGGGYIKIRRVQMDKSSAFMHIINSIGDTLDEMTARVLLENCLHSGMLESKAEKMIGAAIGYRVMHNIPVPLRDTVRATLVKQMLLSQI